MERPANNNNLISHRTWLHRLARTMARSRSGAEDLAQETLTTALTDAPPDAPMRPWLRSVMRRLVWKQTRREERRRELEGHFYHAAPQSALPDATLDYGVDRERLAEAVATLPEPFRSTVVQRFLEGRTCAEIARRQRLPAGTVRWRQSRALELLRAELEVDQTRRARRRRIFWWLPLFGAGERVAGAGSSLVVSGPGKALWLGLAGVAVAFALHSSSEREHAAPVPSDPGPTRRGVHRLTGAAEAGGDSSGSAEPALVSAGFFRARRMGRGQPDKPWWVPVGGQGALDADHQRQAGLLGRFESPGGAGPRARRACELDRDGRLRCPEDSIDASTGVRPTCEFLERTLAFLSRPRKPGPATAADRLVAAALTANTSLAASLGCAGSRESRPGGTADTSCVTLDGEGEQKCAVCTDGSGEETTVCAPVGCQAETRADGALCTRCTDSRGESQVACEVLENCTSTVSGFGQLCTTCLQDGQPSTTCVPAECHVRDRCLDCVDPMGRAATDCTVDYETLSIASSTFSGGDSVNVCTTSWGHFAASATTCRYMGPNSCANGEPRAGLRCIDCGASGGRALCVVDPEAPLPDPQAGRPADLPPPGTCVTEESQGGRVTCTTCTHEDESATRSCLHPTARFCDLQGDGYPYPGCMGCSSVGDNALVTFCAESFD